MRDKIAEIAKMSHEELHAYRWDLLLKIPDIGKISKEELQEIDIFCKEPTCVLKLPTWQK